MNYHTYSSAETKRIATSLAKQILKSGPKKMAVVLALTGELGKKLADWTGRLWRKSII